MTSTRIRTRVIAAIALGAVVLTGTGMARAQEVTLTVHHFLSAKAVNHARFIVPWARRIEAASGGRIAFEIYPSMTLGGAPPELYQQARDGVADIVWTVLGYTPGVFPRAEVFNLPSVHGGSAVVTNLAIQDLMTDQLAEDFQDIHPLLVHVHSGQALHTVDTEVRTIDDMRGLKLRVPSRSGTWMIEAMGADPVAMPASDLPQALSRGVLDGAFIPFEVALPLKVVDIAAAHTELADGRRFGTTTFLLAMNKDRYESLPDDLRAIIDAESGEALARSAGEAWDTFEPEVMAFATARGNAMIQVSAEDTQAFLETFQVVEDRWVEDATAHGLPAAALLAAAKAAVARHQQAEPDR
ncbi:TRAP transporter substrate-binding protein [Roseospira visakhapatnamensis]|uniref:TRAP-type C4-dicarboxylate transport system substrate-binding protein n=1 Tax=Roseospira visakhapatnamensis TaxID=390880 RepID=A0A7W6W9D7_9PROT|nr:TRAP transporter substrate-binding protein [Roseospira visakhapatnamensis]MBB4265759.1 TRAP-type C4-dicarboxylate transport system substrate-binding protein [Roseospira visakhapatnamensis]